VPAPCSRSQGQDILVALPDACQNSLHCLQPLRYLVIVKSVVLQGQLPNEVATSRIEQLLSIVLNCHYVHYVKMLDHNSRSPEDPAQVSTSKLPPYWEPSLELNGYPFKRWLADIYTWSAETELEEEIQAPAVAQRLGGTCQ
jgi:hypothetical protein